MRSSAQAQAQAHLKTSTCTKQFSRYMKQTPPQIRIRFGSSWLFVISFLGVRLSLHVIACRDGEDYEDSFQESSMGACHGPRDQPY